jgi:hypothetical protein
MTEATTLVDRGRGLQLSTSRVTVMDLVPYFRAGCPAEEIRRWIPSLTDEEIAVVAAYYREHKGELDAADDRERAYREEQVRKQRQHTPELNGTPEQKLDRLRGLLRKHRPEVNGEGAAR